MNSNAQSLQQAWWRGENSGGRPKSQHFEEHPHHGLRHGGRAWTRSLTASPNTESGKAPREPV